MWKFSRIKIRSLWLLQDICREFSPSNSITNPAILCFFVSWFCSVKSRSFFGWFLFLADVMVLLKGIIVPTVCGYDMGGTLFLVTDVPIACCSQHSSERCSDYQTCTGQEGISITETSWYHKQVGKTEWWNISYTPNV